MVVKPFVDGQNEYTPLLDQNKIEVQLNEKPLPQVPTLAKLSWVVVGMFVFADHYFRDFVGALDVEVSQKLNISGKDFGLMNTLFFAPNIIMPLFLGVFTSKFTPVGAAIFYAVVASMGYALFSVGLMLESFSIVLISRCVCGLVYESLDMVYFVYFMYVFPDNMGEISALTQVFVRAGSVCSFFFSPFLNNYFSLEASSVTASVIGCLTVPISIIMFIIHKSYLSQRSFSDRSRVVDRDGGFPTPQSFALLNRKFWVFSFGALMMYGTLIPFIMIGSEFLQNKYGYSNESAGYLMLLLEGLCIPLGLIMGQFIDKLTISERLTCICYASIIIPALFLFLGFTAIPAIVLIILLGFAYSSQLLIYFSILAEFIPHNLSSFGTGVAAAMFNVGPAVVPYIVGIFHDHFTHAYAAIMTLFAIISLCVFICFYWVRTQVIKDSLPKNSKSQ